MANLAGYALPLLLVCAPALAWAEDVPVTLEEALRLADEHNADLMVASEKANAQAAQAQVVERLRWPRLSVSTTWTRTDNPGAVFGQKLNSGDLTQDDFMLDNLLSPSGWNHLSSSVTAEVPIDVFGRIGAMAAAQRAGGRAAEAATREARQEIRLRVVEIYHRATLAHRAVEVTERAVAVARGREKEIEARVDEGAALRADRLRAAARRRQREAELAARRGEERVALAALARLLGSDGNVSYVPSEPPPDPGALDPAEPVWIDRALQQRPVLVARREAFEAADWAARAESRSIWPQLGAMAQISDDRSEISGGSQSAMVGISARWNALDLTRSRRSAAAHAERRAAEHALRAASAQVRLEVQMAYRSAAAALEGHAAASGGATEAAEAFRVVRERRQAGLATLTDELETETAALAAELGELSASAEAAIARASLRRAAGEL